MERENNPTKVAIWRGTWSRTKYLLYWLVLAFYDIMLGYLTQREMLKHGPGVIVYPNGSKYEGEFEHDA